VKFIKCEKRSTFLRTQAQNEPKNNSAGLGRVVAVSGVIPKVTSVSLILIEADLFAMELAALKYFLMFFF